ncbi:hypothetical protein ACQ4PT_013293 [Festuca glaucescens]
MDAKHVLVQLKVEGFTWNKAIQVTETRDKFPVLVRLTGAPDRRAEEMACPGVDVVVLLNDWRDSKFEEAMMLLVDRLSPNDRLSISSSRTRLDRPCFTQLMDMSEDGRDVARLKIHELAQSNVQYREYSTDTAAAAKILRQRGEEESASRAGCILHLWGPSHYYDGKLSSRDFPFPLHIVQVGSREYGDLKHITDMTSGTYTFSRYHLPSQNALALFFASIAFPVRTTHTSIKYWSVRITLQAHEGVTISSIASGAYGNLVSSDQQSATVYLHNIYAGQQKAFIVYLTVPQGKEKLLTIGGRYQSGDKFFTVDVAVQRPRRKCLPDEVVIHPKVAAQLLRIQLMDGIAKGKQALSMLNEIKNSDEGHAAPEEILSDLEEEVAEITHRYGANREAMLSSLSFHRLQRSTTDQNIHAFQILDQQRADEHTNMAKVKLQVFTRSKAVTSTDVCRDIPVLVRVTMAPWRHVWEMPSDGVDVVAVLDIGGNMQGKMLDLVKQAMMIVIDKLGPADRLSIVTSQTRNYRFMEPTYMSDDHGPDWNDAMYKINQLRASGRCTGHIASTALQEGAQILRDRTAEESSRRLGCMILLSDGNYPEILQIEMKPEFQVHTFGLGADHNPKVMKYIADKTSGTYSFVNQDISKIKDAVALFITGLTSIAVTSIKITLSACRYEINFIESGNYIHHMESHKRSGTIIIDHIYAGEQKEFIVNMNAPDYYTDGFMTIGGQYKSLGRDNSIAEMKISVLTASVESSPEHLAIHPDVAAELMRIRLQNGVLDMVEKETKSSQGMLNLWQMIKNSDEGRAAPKETLEDIRNAAAKIDRAISGMAYTLSWLSGHKWQRETTRTSPETPLFSEP